MSIILIIIELFILIASAYLSYFCVQNGISVFLRGSEFGSVVVFIVAFIILFFGILVFLYKKRKLPGLPGVVAAQIFALAQAGILVSITLICVWGGTILGEFSIWQIVFAKFNVEIIAVISAIVLLVCSIITCLFCRNDPNDNEFNADQMPDLA